MHKPAMLTFSTLLFLVCLIATTSTETADPNFESTYISAVSWGKDSVDVFGLAPNGSVWHKYNRGKGWRPHRLHFENMNTSAALSKPTAISSQPNRMDFLYITEDRNAHLRYWLGSDWNPPSPEDLGGYFSSPIAAASWGPDRINIVGRGADMNYWHSFWDGIRWRPSDSSRASNGVWEDLGGSFGGAAALASWGHRRMAIFGITPDGALKQKIWDGDNWVPSGSNWAIIDQGPFVGAPAASSWGPGRLDMWAVGQNKNLYHKFWESEIFSNWENLGGNFASVPQVIHWGPDRTDVVGKFDDRSGGYFHKFWDGSRWNPPLQGWYEKKGNFATQASVASSGIEKLDIFGVDKKGTLKLQSWNGSHWLPSAQAWYSLGSTKHPFAELDETQNEEL